MRQPAACPRKVMSGTPMTFAIVRPESTSATPLPRLPGPMSEAATSAATPK
jgi:hypothetical protein